MIAFIEARSSLVEQICEHQFNDEKLCLIRDKVLRGEAKEVVLDPNGVLRIGGRICVPKTGDLIRLILEEAHCSRYSIHPGAAKMYHDMSQHYWWCGMKRDISDFVSRCFTCQQVKCEHQRPGVYLGGCLFLLGSGSGLLWTLLWVFLPQWVVMTLFGLLLIG